MKRSIMTLALMLAPMPVMPAMAQPDVKMATVPVQEQDGAIALYPDQPAPTTGRDEQWSRMQVQLGTNSIDNVMVRNVVRPTITPYLPDPAKATGAAVIVAPGGAFLSLSMTGEGSDVARWLADHGVAAFVLKYRLNETPRDDKAFLAVMGQRFSAAAQPGAVRTIEEPRATQDALKALEIVRERAASWRVDPARVGMIGFSAGAMTTLNSVLEGQSDQRPAFIGYIYGPMTSIAVPADAPPMFSAIAMDDGLFKRQGFGIVEAWRAAGRPVEFHAYERGDHGFGAGRPGMTTAMLLPEFLAWMDMRGLLGAH